jgi:plasmid stability protein
MSIDDLHFRLRIPDDLKSMVELAARQNHRSMTAEINARLRASFDENAGETPSLTLRELSHKIDRILAIIEGNGAK